jgi:hypothetical protein
MMMPLTESEIATLRTTVQRVGLVGVQADTGMRPSTICRALAGMRLHAGTSTSLRLYLAQPHKSEKPAVAAAGSSFLTFPRPENDSKTCSYPAR